ncbi:MAG TPA: DEAD/DEAH box helicase, partial [Steroidobacteraceae bacterium]|nr:DEAD/DEAH box helicase [Steroidobacteraceae bacterium]
MALSPFETFEHLKESLCSYLETAYKISDATIFRERGERLRASVAAPLTPVTTQEPFIESTPPFAASEYLADLVARMPELPDALEQLAAFGMPVRSSPLYDHQREAIERAYTSTRNLVVATGTGSGKTEIFLLLILAEILKEALLRWEPPRGPALPGEYSARDGCWLSVRRHERRKAAIRAIVLYPMNALVNDQVQRLRRVLAGSASEAWQRATLRDNLISFGMYTGDRRPTGHWSDERRRRDWSAERAEAQRVWDGLPEELRGRGNWPQPDGPEMLCRWDMQEAPPDILVTNYSMLEYMLVRPIESKMLDLTHLWLKTAPDAQLTLVVDEAHTYTGARGTEIAYLIRRLKERLGITPGDGRLRCIATSASLPDDVDARAEVLRFASELFGEDQASFWPVSAPPIAQPAPHKPSDAELDAFARFAEGFDTLDPMPAVAALSQALGAAVPQTDERAEIALARALQGAPQAARARALTARRATRLPELAEMLWGGLGNDADRRRATAGIFAAGAFARERDATDAQPLISSRVHMFFRGIAGLWACMNAHCTAAARPECTDAPVGRLSFEPHPWCACGSRVLEVFTCRVCGLLFLGGIPDATGSLWPWTSDLESGRPDLDDYTIFGVEPPEPGAPPSCRSVRSTRPAASSDADARPVYEIQPAIVSGAAIPFPAACPRCRSRRGRGPEGREIVEPL